MNSLKLPLIILAICAPAVMLISCSKEKHKGEYVARVESSYLSTHDIAQDIDTAGLQKSRKNEYVRNWIETELFNYAAGKEGIFKDADYQRTVNKAKREIAKAFLIEHIIKEKLPEIKTEELEQFFNSHKEEFRLFNESYLYNSITFNNEEKAILFRNTLIESDWTKATNVFHNDKEITEEKTGVLQDAYQLQPVNLFAVVQELMPGETSTVLETEPSGFTVVQLVKRFNSRDIPEFGVIRPQVEERFKMVKKEEIVKQYLKELYSKYTVEIKLRK
ncbi:MAG: peptidyl-prolyl cis-trans isomerase [Methanococcaceae archaeon]